jgi:hypothetical protein
MTDEPSKLKNNASSSPGDRAPRAKENRPVLYITYADDRPDDAAVLDVSGSIEEARRQDNAGRPCYRVHRIGDGEYGKEEFVEWLTR